MVEPYYMKNNALMPYGYGVRRTSTASPWEPYTFTDPRNFEQWSDAHSRLNGRWSGGGPWTMKKSGHISTARRWTNSLVNGDISIGGPSFTVAKPAKLFNVPSELDLIRDGTTCIARTEPTNPAFDMSVFIAELRREGLPNLPGTQMREATNRAKAAGSEYLNYEFGWAPLVRGVRDFAKTVNESDRVINAYRRDANQLIHRRYDLLKDQSAAVSYGNFTIAPTGASSSKPGTATITRKQNRWFSGAYKYHLPTGDGVANKFARYGSYARKLLGVELTPEVLWNLAPWSWAIDWFGNTGDVIHNVAAIGRDGMALKYGYIMDHTEETQEWFVPFFGISRTQYTVSKLRRSASPYGFGVSWDGFSPKQLAILSAIGISRL